MIQPSVSALLLLIAPLLVRSLPKDAPVCLATDRDSDCLATDRDSDCGLWLAASASKPDTFGLFTGKKRSINEHVADPDVLVAVVDANKNEWSPLHDFLTGHGVLSKDGLPLEGQFLNDFFSPGAGPLAYCSDEYANMKAASDSLKDYAGVHRFSDPTAGSFSYHHNFAFSAMRDLVEGEELAVPCSRETKHHADNEVKRTGRPVEWLKQNGICLDSFSVAPSTLPGVGRGAFSKRAVEKDKVITSTPVVHFDRSQLEIVEQSTESDEKILGAHKHGIQYTDKVVGQQLLLNYCFGHPDSNILLLPYAPGVNIINHNSEKANAVIRWSPLSMGLGLQSFLAASPNVLFVFPASHGILIEFIALRDILPGEEIFIDYGEEWTQAWEKHVSEWKPQDKDYVAATEYRRLHTQEPIRTLDEQKSNPYPENLRTACYFAPTEEDIWDMGSVEWSSDNFNCLRPCDITERYEEDKRTYYTAVVYPTQIAVEADYCGNIPEEGSTVKRLPMSAAKVADKPYSTDAHLQSVFRHEIGVPAGFYPEVWMAADSNPMGDFIPSPLEPGEMAIFRWAGSGDVVAPNAHRLGLHSRVRETLLDYCNKMGITDYFKHVTIGGNAMPIGTHAYITLNGDQWFLQRPDKNWQSNLQWISPGDENSQQSYLEALSAAGFDEILGKIGESLGMNGLVAFHVTFIGASHSTKGFMHTDVGKTGAKTFNVIIPLILANDTGPELDLQDSEKVNDNDELLVGRYRYEYDVASMLGDDAFVSAVILYYAWSSSHATAV
jgi:hypothetical protein